MKLSFPKNRRRGLTIVVILTCLAIMSFSMMGNARATFQLHEELKLIEARQLARWDQTN